MEGTTGERTIQECSKASGKEHDMPSDETEAVLSSSMPSMPSHPPCSRKRNRQRKPQTSIIKIISARYGPCESLTTDSSATSENDDAETTRRNRIPFTRECAPFLLSLLIQIRQSERGENEGQKPEIHIDEKGHHEGVLFPTNLDGKKHAFVHLLGGRRGKLSMNAIFGDPCPGTSKRLNVHYTVTEITEMGNKQQSRDIRTEVHQVSFAEHEPVQLRRCLAVLKREDSRRDIHESSSSNIASKSIVFSEQDTPALATTSQEVALPLVLPFLELKERVKCSVVSRFWRKIIQEWGVATVIDANDPRTMNITNENDTGMNQWHLTRPVFRGLLRHSYTSLHSLFLSGFGELKQEDFHPALPPLRTLTTLDITKCTKLDDSTMKLIAQHLSDKLRVLYLKGLYTVTDDGLMAICMSCLKLEVLDVSQLMNITDESGIAIRHLTVLQALFTRDNYQLTNRSLDAITEKCTKLRQLTLWGLIGIQNLQFSNSNGRKLTILNLWGCHNLGDDLADALESLSLRSLILSECHQLSDDFIVAITKISGLQNLQHLHLRYLIKISDISLKAIAQSFRRLYSLDLSFCSGISATGIYLLLNRCREHLTELRLKSIRNLDIAYSSRQHTNERNDRRDHTGHWILNALRPLIHTNIDHTLCVLDVRQCGGHLAPNRPYDEKDQFVLGMYKLKFKQTVPGFFSRPVTVPVAEHP